MLAVFATEAYPFPCFRHRCRYRSGDGAGGQSVPFTFTFPDAAGLCPPDREMEAFLPLAGRNAVVSGQGNSNVRLVRHGCTGHPDSIQPDSGRFFLQQGASSDWRFSGRLSAAFSCTRQQLCVLTVEARRDSFHSGLSGMNGSLYRLLQFMERGRRKTAGG